MHQAEVVCSIPFELCLSNDVGIRFYEISWFRQRFERLSGGGGSIFCRKGEVVLLLNYAQLIKGVEYSATIS